jgi:hypothetical protein
VAHYRDRFGFAPVHQDAGFAVLRRDDAELHLWGAVDEAWRTRARPRRQADRLRGLDGNLVSFFRRER